MLIVFTIGSLFPLVWTAIAASRNNTRLAQTPPPFWFGGNLFKNLEIAWTDANMGDGAAQHHRRGGHGRGGHGRLLDARRVRLRQAALPVQERCCMVLVIGTMMVPPQLSVVPLYMLIAEAVVDRPAAGRHPARRWSAPSACSSCGSTSAQALPTS